MIYLLIATQSSPLYPFNDWVDANYYFTMGKGVMHGLVPYQDLFERKGPLLYFIYGLASLVSYRSFLGVFILEVIAFSFFLFISFKILNLFVNRKLAATSLPLLAILILNLKAFAQGGSAEEFCLPLAAVSIYHLLRFLKSNDPSVLTRRTFFWNGVIAGCVLWVKFSMLGFWLGWIIALFVNLILQRRNRQAFFGVGVFLIGILAATVPWILYFGINHAIPDWINTYFIINLTSYTEKLSFLARLGRILSNLATQFSNNPLFSSMLWLGLVAFIAFPKFISQLGNRLLLLSSVILFIAGIYGGGRVFDYYYLIMAPFVMLGFVVIFDASSMIKKQPLSEKLYFWMVISMVVVSIPLMYRFNQNSYMLHVSKEDLVQYKFAKIIDQSANKTLLNYGWLDMGFYTTTGTLPRVKYFASTNLDYSRYPLEINEQQRYIREGLVDFVVLMDYASNPDPEKNLELLNPHYQLVSKQIQTYETNPYVYLLFEKAR
ncbi:MAG: hypothetical protein ABFD51_02160 [Anaerolineaceae bacterium]